MVKSLRIALVVVGLAVAAAGVGLTILLLRGPGSSSERVRVMFDGLAGSWDLSLDRTVEWMMEAEPDMRYWRAEELRAWMSNDRATAEFREDGSFAIDVLESESAHRDRWTLTGVTSPDGHLRLQSHRMTGLDEQPYASWSLVGTYERDASGYRVHLSDATTGADYGTTLIHVGKAEIRFQHDGGVPFRHMVLLRR